MYIYTTYQKITFGQLKIWWTLPSKQSDDIFVNNILFCQMVSTYRQRKVYSVMAMESTQHLKDLVIMESGKMTRWMEKVSMTVKVIFLWLLEFLHLIFHVMFVYRKTFAPIRGFIWGKIANKLHQSGTRRKKRSEGSVFDNIVKKVNWKEAAVLIF